ncbi:hypothetical protein VSH64_24860 [Amycolatopsis rhabdoformis]|uniref:Uncharacterized protein n=1 Tax=Amycolatopsis rhabdoformis TaxID=1448059 RepID=A0ABZ1HW26_9PSEU|nr:hypothetical protein [Amycolatopsis rhabdoformis]WSE26109.1 hypothetical protein VSH64_24860 [Amycolatopsis rhabdoformis]
MAVQFVRAKCDATGAVTSLAESALQHLPAWRAVDGPVPDRPKPATFPRTSGEAPENEDADSSSANTEQE